jgi:hypothetical protein
VTSLAWCLYDGNVTARRTVAIMGGVNWKYGPIKRQRNEAMDLSAE